MEVKEKKVNKTWKNIKNKKIIIIFALILAVAIVGYLIINDREGDIKIIVKSSLDKIVEKNDLETATITYNVIAKKCKNPEKCNMNSRNISDYELVISCTGTITAGIDFKNVKLDVDKKNKIVTVIMPDAVIMGEPTVEPSKTLNGDDLPPEKLPEAIKLCQETVKEKSNNDGKLLPAAKEQARVVLEEYYNQWVNAQNPEYKVVVN